MQSEDAFTLNILASGYITPNFQVVVLFWVCGGALNGGSSDSIIFDGPEWSRAEASRGKKSIVVSSNYRTNICGFFSGAEFKAVDELGLSRNCGAYDIIHALTWVTFPLDHAYAAYSAVLASHAPDEAATSNDRIDQLRVLPIDELIETHRVNYTFYGVALTIEDGPHAIWTDDVIDRLERRERDEWIEAVIIGTKEHEGATAADFMQADTAAGFSRLVSTFSSSLQTEINQKYLEDGRCPAECELMPHQPGAKLLGGKLFYTPAWRQARAFACQPNKTSGRETRVYMYRFKDVNDRLAKTLPLTLDLHIHSRMPLSSTSRLPRMREVTSPRRPSWVRCGLSLPSTAALVRTGPWRPFTSEQPSWMAIESGGKINNESLVDYQDTWWTSQAGISPLDQGK